MKYVDIEITEADMYSYTRIRENIEEELIWIITGKRFGCIEGPAGERKIWE